MKNHLFKAFAVCLFVGIAAININITFEQSEKGTLLRSIVTQATAAAEGGYSCTGKQYWTPSWDLKCDASHNSPCSASVPC